MAVYEINGSRYEIPDELEGAELEQTLTLLSEQDGGETQEQQAPEQPQESAYSPVAKSIDPDILTNDPDWLRASRHIHKMNHGTDFEGSDADLAEWGLDYMGFFNYNLPAMAVDTAMVSKAGQSEKDAFLYMMDTYDNLDMSWSGTGRFFKGVLTDPTTYIGLGTLGVGLLGKEGAKQLGKQGIKQALKTSLGRTGVVAGVEGAMYGAADNTMRQAVEVTAGRKDEISTLETLKAVGVGAAVGVVGGTALDAVATGIRNRFRNMGDTTPGASTGASKAADPETRVEPTIGPREEPPATPRGADEVAPEGVPTRATPEGQPEALPAPSTEVLPLSPSREVGSEGAIRIEVDDVLDHRAASDIAPSRSLENPIPFIPRNMEEITHFARSLGEELRGLHYTQAEDVLQDLKGTKMTQAEWGDFNRSTQIAVDDLRLQLAAVIKESQTTTNSEKLAELVYRQAELEDLLAPVAMVDEAFSSMTGSMLRQRQEGLTELRGVSPESIMKESGVSRGEAEVEFLNRVERAAQTKEGKAATREYDQKVQQALASGDTMEASRWAAMRQMHMGAIAGNDVRAIHKLNELIISNVFSATTLAINIVPSLGKTLYRPALDALLSNPLEAITRRQAAATYSAMRSSIGGAWRAAKASFRYEQSLLTRDAGRLAEGELAITGKKAGYVRIFPRLLNATDEFLSQVNYHGYIAGETAGAAHEAGLKEGLKGKQLDAYVKGRVNDALERSYTSGDDEAALAVMLNKGVNLNLKGEDLMNYVQRELLRDPKAIRHGNNEEAVNYVRDVLYKRSFSGTNTASKVAKGYEKMVNDAPVMRLVGQLFFRTPVRVFEEGVRLTPGLQLIHPTFIKDLRGLNGRRNQARAQGEAMMSLAFTGTVLSLYAQGRITGDGAYSDWKQQRNRTDSDKTEPYTLTLDDGTTWSFKNFDPIATPVKIMINALERYENYHLRESQGEFIGQDNWDRVTAALTIGTGAIGQAVRDASLMSGVDGLMDLAENAVDPEKNEGNFVKLIGDKLRMLVPNTMHKIAKTNDPTIDDPKTFWQVVESRVLGGATLGAYDKTGPKSYDYLGNVRQTNDTGALWNIFSASTLEERKKGLNETQLDVLRKLDYVSKQTGVSFVTPYVHKLTGKMDLRSEMTSDGKETLYDRWNSYYKAFQPEETLSQILDAGLPVGTTSVDGATVTLIRQYINDVRDAAFHQLMAEEAQVSERVFSKMGRELEVKAGFWDQ